MIKAFKVFTVILFELMFGTIGFMTIMLFIENKGVGDRLALGFMGTLLFWMTIFLNYIIFNKEDGIWYG